MVLTLIYICLKPQNDILQGLSKLDHLVKVSIFQIYRYKPIQDLCDSFISDMDETGRMHTFSN